VTVIVWFPAEALAGDVTLTVADTVAPAAIVKDDDEKLEVKPAGSAFMSAYDVAAHVDESVLRTET